MDLAAALEGAELAPAARDLEVLRVASDSRRVAAGDLFVAIRGAKSDGLAHVEDAVRRGAVAVVSDRPAPAGVAVPWIEVSSPRRALALAAARLNGNPAEKLVLAAVTGTNGKTSTTTLLEAILARRYGAAGFLGTVGYRTARRSIEADRTTPEAPLIQELLAEMVAEGTRAAAMEVSSHSLALDRVEGCRFDVAVFTNLTRDHLDFHGDMESYYQAKKRLFGLRKPGACGVDQRGRRLRGPAARGSGAPGGELLAVGEPPRSSAPKMPAATSPASRSTSRIRGAGCRSPRRCSVGSSCRTSPGPRRRRSASASRRPTSPPRSRRWTTFPGRLERVEAGQSYTDPRRLRAHARRPRAAASGRARADGQEDPARVRLRRRPRPRQARADGRDRRAAGRHRHRDVRQPAVSEDPEAILRDVEAGLTASGATKYLKIADRGEAIRQAIELANPGTVVVIAGKGHETTQVIGAREIPFDDRRVAAGYAGRA